MGAYPLARTIHMEFHVYDIHPHYNDLLRRKAMLQLRAEVSTLHNPGTPQLRGIGGRPDKPQKAHCCHKHRHPTPDNQLQPGRNVQFKRGKRSSARQQAIQGQQLLLEIKKCSTIESLKVEIKSLKTENKVLKSGESELSEKIDQMKSQVSKLSEKLQISNQEMKQQIILFEEDKRMLLTKNEFLQKVSFSVQKEYNDLLASNDVLKQRLETKFKFLKHDNSLEKIFESIEKEYESNVSKISITSSTFETKNLELVKEMGDKVKRFDDEKKVFEQLASQNYTSLQKDNNDLRTSYNVLKEKYKTSCEKLEKENNDLNYTHLLRDYDYFQEIINLDFEKIDSPFQQTSSLKLYVPTVILEKIIIDLEDEVVSHLEKEKEKLEIIESLKSKGFESSENTISESENQSENNCQKVEKGCDNLENSKVIAPGMFKINVSQSVSPISTYNPSCASNNVENKTKRKRRKRTSSKQNDKQVNVSEKIYTGKSSKPISRNVSQFTTYSLQKDRKYQHSFETFASQNHEKNESSKQIWKRKGENISKRFKYSRDEMFSMRKRDDSVLKKDERRKVSIHF
ncbi:hypothetical protein Tco_1351176 [Tanacetum coccineum]